VPGEAFGRGVDKIEGQKEVGRGVGDCPGGLPGKAKKFFLESEGGLGVDQDVPFGKTRLKGATVIVKG
jgi:hypothetical protein